MVSLYIYIYMAFLLNQVLVGTYAVICSGPALPTHEGPIPVAGLYTNKPEKRNSDSTILKWSIAPDWANPEVLLPLPQSESFLVFLLNKDAEFPDIDLKIIGSGEADRFVLVGLLKADVEGL